MEKFTKTNAEKYIRTSNDAQVAQLGHLNALMDSIQIAPTNLLVKEGSISVAEITTMVNDSFPPPPVNSTHVLVPKEPGKYTVFDHIVLKINSTNNSNQLNFYIGTPDLFNNATYLTLGTSTGGGDDLVNGIFYLVPLLNNKIDNYTTPFVSENLCIYTTSSIIPYVPLNAPIQYKVYYRTITF